MFLLQAFFLRYQPGIAAPLQSLGLWGRQKREKPQSKEQNLSAVQPEEQRESREGFVPEQSGSESPCLPGLLPGWYSLHSSPCSEDGPWVPIQLLGKETNRFYMCLVIWLCDVIQRVITKRKFSKAEPVCFQRDPSGKPFYFHISLL